MGAEGGREVMVVKAVLWQHEQKGHKLKKDQNSYKDTKRNVIIIIIVVVITVIIIIMRSLRLFFQ